jgi:TIR domain-containing protein/pentapeptide repeat protein
LANPEHLAILERGVEVWNKWREMKLRVKPDLRAANLKRADLGEANFLDTDLSDAILFKADLFRSNLTRAILNGANLCGALLIEANLYMALLRKANLSWASLGGAELTGAALENANLNGANLNGGDLTATNLLGVNLSVADLHGVHFSRANLYGAEFKGSKIAHAYFADVDLSHTRSLELVKHEGPSSIGIDTIYKSKGKIPESFLRGCGVPEDFIKLIPSLTSQPFDFYSCFISYSTKDDDFARRLHADSQAAGVRVWFAPEDLKIGDKIRDRLDQSIRLYDKLLLILTEDSIESDWVEKEVETAFEKERRNPGKTVLFPIRLDDAVMDTDKAWAADIRRTRHIGNFTDWKDHDSYQKAFDRLLRDLKASEE